MNTAILDTLQLLVHRASLVVICASIVFIIIGIAKPAAYQKVMSEFTERKYIAICGVFICLLSGTIFIATQQTTNSSFVSENTKRTIEIASQAPLENQAQAEVAAIKVQELTTDVSINFQKETKQDPTMPSGETKVVQYGVTGLKKITYEVTYDNGTEVARTVKSESIVTNPINEITAIGSKVAQPKPASQLPKPDFKCKKDDSKKDRDNCKPKP